MSGYPKEPEEEDSWTITQCAHGTAGQHSPCSGDHILARINSDIKNLLDSCETCKSLEPQQAKQPLKNLKVIDQRWAKLGADLFRHDGNDHMITVDYLTNFWEVDNLTHDLTALSIIYKLRQQFARHGAHIELVMDKGPQFVSEQFEAFHNAGVSFTQRLARITPDQTEKLRAQ